MEMSGDNLAPRMLINPQGIDEHRTRKLIGEVTLIHERHKEP